MAATAQHDDLPASPGRYGDGVGRSIRNADRLEMTDLGDCVRNDFGGTMARAFDVARHQGRGHCRGPHGRFSA